MDSIQSQIRAKSFVTELNESSMIYEVKRTRAVFDDSLAIPGTDRRGGWRCPPGTRYGGQITDRFGRNCGWGVSRRLANEISDLGERLENIGDRRRGRRAARAERAAARVRRPGLVERAAGNVARALDTDGTADSPKPSRTRRGAGRIEKPRRANLRDSELRRMEREIENPGAPRTGDVENPPTRRPRPPAPAARRRPATQQVAREKPKPEVDAPEAPAPAKKAPAKKAAAKKKAVKKKAPAKKAPARRVTSAAGGNDEPPKMSAKPQAAAKQPAVKVGDEGLSEENLRNLVGMNAGAFDVYNADIQAINDGIDNDMNAWREGNIPELQAMVDRQDDYVNGMKQDLQRAVDKLRADGPNADEKELQRLQDVLVRENKNYAVGIHRRNALKNRLSELRGNKEPQPEAAPRQIPQRDALGMGGFRRNDIVNAKQKYEDVYGKREINQINSIREIDAHMAEIVDSQREINQYIFNLNNVENGDNAVVNFPDGDMSVSEIRRNLEQAQVALAEAFSLSQERKAQLMNNPDAPEVPELPQVDVLDKPEKAVDILDGDKEALADVKKRIADVIDVNKKGLADYLNKVYGANNKPWKDMTREKLIDLKEKAMNGDDAAKQELFAWGRNMFEHKLIEGKNGKNYSIEAKRFSFDRGNLVMVGEIYYLAPNGNKILIGNTTRSVYMNNASPDNWFAENNYMKIDVAEHKAAGIQSVYNQHSFMYLKAAGFKKVYLGAAWDGKYVWGRVGFRQQIDRSAVNMFRGEINKFKDGRPSLIKNENEARRINALMEQLNAWYEIPAGQRPDLQPVRHMDFVYALDIPNGRGKKTRQSELRDWFIAHIPINAAYYYFDENGVTEDPRD